jgi:hypothetical protein
MSDLKEYWDDVKHHYREKKNAHEKQIYPVYEKLLALPECTRVGDHHRIGEWDFWYTGTVMNYKTHERSSFKALLKAIPTPTKKIKGEGI